MSSASEETSTSSGEHSSDPVYEDGGSDDESSEESDSDEEDDDDADDIIAPRRGRQQEDVEVPLIDALPVRKGRVEAMRRIEASSRKRKEPDHLSDEDNTPVVTPHALPPRKRKVVLDERPIEDRQMSESEVLFLLTGMHDSKAAVLKERKKAWRKAAGVEMQAWLAAKEAAQMESLKNGTFVEQTWQMPASGHALPSAAPTRGGKLGTEASRRKNTYQQGKERWDAHIKTDTHLEKELEDHGAGRNAFLPRMELTHKAQMAREETRESGYQNNRDREQQSARR